jgi:hypothetical protein
MEVTPIVRSEGSRGMRLAFDLNRTRFSVSVDKLNGNTQSDWKSIGLLIQIGHVSLDTSAA